MKLPSLRQITDESARTLRRFPVVLADAAVGTAAASVLVERDAPNEPGIMFSVFFAALLGIPLLTGLKLFAEKRTLAALPTAALQALGVLLLAGYATTIPANFPGVPALHAMRLMMLVVAMHLFVAIAPWLGRGQLNGFWQFNKTLFLRALTAALFTFVLWGGLSIALAAVENLFGVSVPGKRYMELWVVLNGVFTTWFFLAGVPADLEALDAMSDYPKGLKIFTQYVLLPLVLIYLGILASYTGKIAVTWTWPHGWVSRLILGFSTAGMFAMLLLHPIRDLEGNRWIRNVSRWFYVLLSPLLVVYFLAVFRRLSEYGITEGRYIAVVTGVWLAAMVLYFLFSRGKSLKAIPLTLCVLALLISAGPWSAFAVSERSQVARLEALFAKHAIIDAGKVRKAPAPVGYEDAKQISGVLSYLREAHGYDAIQPWFAEPLRSDSLGAQSGVKDPSVLAEYAGVEYVAQWPGQSETVVTFDATEDDAAIITGYDRALTMRWFAAREPSRTITAGEAFYKLSASLDTLLFTLKRPGKEVATLEVPLLPVRDQLLRKYHNNSAAGIPLENMCIEAGNNEVKLKAYLRQLHLDRADGKLSTRSVHIQVLYGLRPAPGVQPN